MLCADRLGTKSYTHIVEPKFEIAHAAESGLAQDMARLETGEPIQYVLGKAEFCGRTFKVKPGVLIPRPETELLCREAVKVAERMVRQRRAYGKGLVRILDLCTGSGCIAWTMYLDVPGSEVVGVDISDETLSVAFSQRFENSDKKGPQISFVHGDLLQPEIFPEIGKFDMILSNPPYIMESEKTNMRKNVLDHEPSLALFVPDDDPLIFYRSVASISKRLLLPDGCGLVEINEVLGPQTRDVFKEEGFRTVEIVKDFNDRNRFVKFA